MFLIFTSRPSSGSTASSSRDVGVARMVARGGCAVVGDGGDPGAHGKRVQGVAILVGEKLQ